MIRFKDVAHDDKQMARRKAKDARVQNWKE
jgi:hypothetical protein